jgi:DNA-binding LacI/PurR family transcriptional regulator
MARIREGRKVEEHGCIGILVDTVSKDEWLDSDGTHETFTGHLDGYRKEAEAHGYRAECFFLRAPDSSPEIVERRLRARGITGLILASPRLAKVYPDVRLRWENFACVAVGREWREVAAHHVDYHSSHNMWLAIDELVRRDCRRIGFCQPQFSMARKATSGWLARYLAAQWEYDALPKLPPFIGTIHETTTADFSVWFRRWKPDALVTIIGDEMPRLRAMGIKLRGVDAAADDKKALQVVCVNRPRNSPFPGVDANHELLGRNACKATVNQLTCNQHGLPGYPNETLIPGRWVNV